MRCPSCGGLRVVTERRLYPHIPCVDCRRGKVVPRSQFHNYWLERFTREEIQEMALAIWG